MVKIVERVDWEAEEYVVRDRNVGWYFGLFIVAAALIALSVWQHWWTFLILVVLCVIVLLTSNLRPPRKIKYTLDKRGLTEGGKLHKYDEYRAFGILKEGTHYSIILIPKKRFGVQTKVYFPEKNGEEIVDALGMRMPMEEIKLDIVDKLVNFLRI